MSQCPICKLELNGEPVTIHTNGSFDRNDVEHQRPPGHVEYDCSRCTRYNVALELANRGFLPGDLGPALSAATREHWGFDQNALAPRRG